MFFSFRTEKRDFPRVGGGQVGVASDDEIEVDGLGTGVGACDGVLLMLAIVTEDDKSPAVTLPEVPLLPGVGVGLRVDVPPWMDAPEDPDGTSERETEVSFTVSVGGKVCHSVPLPAIKIQLPRINNPKTKPTAIAR